MLATIQHSVTVTGADQAGVEVNSSQWNEPHVATFSIGATDISGLFSNANGVSFGLSDSSVTASHNALTTAMASNRGTDFVQAAAVFAGTSASGTIASGGISVSIGPYITTAMLSNRGSDFVQAAAAFAGTSASGTIASDGISVSIGPYITTAMLSNRGSDFVQAGAAFAGTSASGTIASNGISVSIGPYITTAALSNHSHGNPALALTNLSGTTASASNGLTLSLSAAAPGAGGGATLSWWQNLGPGSEAFPRSTLNITGAERVFLFQPLQRDFGPFPGNMTVATLMMPMNLSGSTATMSAAFTSSFSFGFYTNNAGTLSLVNSATTSIGKAAAATDNSTLYAGSRWLTLGTAQWSSEPAFSAGIHYWWCFGFRSSSRLNQTFSVFGENIWASASTFAGTIGAASSANNTSKGIAPFYGNYTVTSNALPASVGSNQFNKQVATAVFMPHMVFNNIAATF